MRNIPDTTTGLPALSPLRNCSSEMVTLGIE